MTTHNSQHSAEALEAFTPQPLDIAMNTEATETPASWARPPSSLCFFLAR